MVSLEIASLDISSDFSTENEDLHHDHLLSSKLKNNYLPGSFVPDEISS